MVREIEVATFLKNMGQGVSRPVLVIGDDFKEYILKNENIDNNGTIQKYNCMFINELLAYQIGPNYSNIIYWYYNWFVLIIFWR